MRLIGLVVGVEFLPDRDHPFVHGMRFLARDFHDNGFLHLVRDHGADQDLAVRFRFGPGSAGFSMAHVFRHYFFSVLRVVVLPAVLSAASSCSRRTVWTRAISRRSPRIFFRLSVCPIFIWNFSLKSWSAKSRSWCLSSTSVKLRIFSAFINQVSVLRCQVSGKALLLDSLLFTSTI